jgi:hypothetical protein
MLIGPAIPEDAVLKKINVIYPWFGRVSSVPLLFYCRGNVMNYYVAISLTLFMK